MRVKQCGKQRAGKEKMGERGRDSNGEGEKEGYKVVKKGEKKE